MKIIALEAENIKRLIAVEIKPTGNMVKITGKNGQGKTSVLDSIWWALAGLGNVQKTPIRAGQAQARIKLDLGEIVVTRTFKAKEDGDYTTTIAVENAEGSRFPSPQTMLDGLLGQLTFDPLAFTKMDPKKQFDTLRCFVPGVNFEKIDEDNKTDYTKRTELNRRAKEARTLAESIIIKPGSAIEPVDENELISELESAAKHNSNIQLRKGNRERLIQDISFKQKEVDRITGEIDQLKKLSERLKSEAENLQTKLKDAGALPEQIDLSELRKKIDSAKGTNAGIALYNEKRAHEENSKALEAETEALTKSMSKRETDKKNSIAAAKFPVTGLSLGDGEILLRGLPFNQASDAEQLRSSIAIAMALNPKLRVLRVRDGSLLDDESMKLVELMATDKDYQVWIERVSEDGQVGFVLEDGQLKQQQLIEGDSI